MPARPLLKRRLIIAASSSGLIVLATTLAARFFEPRLDFLTYPGLLLAWLVVPGGVHSDSIAGAFVGFIGLFLEWVSYTVIILLATYGVARFRKRSVTKLTQ